MLSNSLHPSQAWPEAVITGTGLLASSGSTEEEVWQALLRGDTQAGRRIYATAGIGDELAYPVYGIEQERLQALLLPSEHAALERWGLAEDADVQMLIAVIRQALVHAGLATGTDSLAWPRPCRVSLVIGHENLGVTSLADRLLGQTDTTPAFSKLQQSFFHLQTFPYLFYIAQLFGVDGMAYTVNNACASGLYALELGRKLLLSGDTDVVIVACSDYAHVTEYLWLDEKGALSPSGALRPFDTKRDGSVLGDGAGALILETAEHARLRGALPLCSYTGGCFAQDSWSMTLPDVSRHTYASVIEGAVRKGKRETVDLLIPHGSGSRLWDRYEAAEITLAMDRLERDVPLIAAFKGGLGHTLGASAMMELLLGIRCLREQLVPATAHCEIVDPKLGMPVVQRVLQTPLQSIIKAVPAYGGFHAACRLERWS